ncbi:MAG: ribonuclease E/G, partial [Pseudomonadota bacterium]
AQRKKEEEEEPKKKSRSRSRSKAKKVESEDAVTSEDASDISGMETIDIDDEEGSSPMELVAETPVETPAAGEEDEDDGETEEASIDASEKDDSIESVAEEDDSEDVRPVRKPRPRRYKIQEVIKVRQILLTQVVKEERGNKGAALTTYLSLAGRYCVLMPNTARGGGISRKITNAADRKKLKEIAGSIEVPQGAGLIVRTAGAKRTKTEIKRDYEYLQRLWEQIRELTLKSTAPAKIYEEGDLIKRSIRDLYGKEIDEVIVEGDGGYRTAKDFMKMIMPSHAKNVKHYTDGLPLFARHQVEGYLDGMFNPTVQLKSGGYIVIGITEALVAIDVNSGRATKEGSIEDTAVKTNLEAAEEVARQLRLRDLAGLIVIDFIDMEDRRNNAKVEKMMKEKLKTDRARIQVGRISGFGLMEMSRQRLRPGMLEASTQPCPHCHGTGLIRSNESLGLTILRALDEEGTRRRTKEVLVKAPVAIANFLINQKREHIAQIEARHGMAVRVEADPTLVSPDYSVEKFKTATRAVAEAPVITGDASLMEDVEDEAEETQVAAVEPVEETAGENEGAPKKKRRRRRRRRGGGGSGEANASEGATDAAEAAEAAEAAPSEPQPDAAEEDEKPAKKTRSRSRSKKKEPAPEVAESAEEAAPAPAEPAAEPAAPEPEEPGPAPAKKKRVTRSRSKKTEEAPAAPLEAPAASTPEPAEVAVAHAPEQAAPETKSKVPEPVEAAPSDAPEKPKRKGWWSLGR